jgi:CBS domain-containing protein
MNEPVASVLAHKGTAVYSVPPTATVLDAVVRMNEQGIGALLVLNAGRPVGIFTERDVLRRVVAERKDPATTEVAAVMTRELVVVKPSIAVQDAMAVISETRCRHLPVVQEGQVLGIVSIGDLTRWVGRDREVRIQQLVDFVTGKYPA